MFPYNICNALKQLIYANIEWMSRETKHDTDLRGNKIQNEINISFMRECVCVCAVENH